MADELEEYLDSIERNASYRIIRVLKSSDFETTELVQDECSGRYFIRKRIAAESGIGHSYERLFEEQKAGRKAGCVPAIVDCFLTEDGLTVVMEYVAGKTLADVVFEYDPSIKLASQVIPQICDAVTELHEAYSPPIIHRDLKPSNIIVDHDGVKIIDFGIARTYRDDAKHDTRHFGTPSYAPPEQFGFGQTDTRSDVYALGMLLYFCLTERTPNFETIEADLTNCGIPEPLQNVILKATAFDPKQRYESVRAMKADLLMAAQKAGARPCKPIDAMGDAKEAKEGRANSSTPQNARTIQDPALDSTSQAPNNENAGNASISQSDKVGHSLLSRLPSIPRPIGLIWNVLVALIWAIIMLGCVFAVISPNEVNSSYGTLTLIIVYPVLMGGSFLMIAFMMIHKPTIGFLSPLLSRFGALKIDAACVLAAFVLMILAVIVYGIAPTNA